MPGLFDKTKIKSMTLKNRIVRSATFENMADKDGSPTEGHYKLYENLAKGGVGLITTGLTFVSQDGKNTPVGMLGIDSDKLIPEYKKLVKHVHKHGAAISMQIAHAGRQTSKRAIGTTPIAPSAVKDKTTFVIPREMTEDDIERVINDFAQAARRVKESGFDAVQLHGAHGYLVSTFLCPHTNRRTDRWGGSLENRMRFVTEIYNGCRKLVGKDYPILIKMNAYDTMKNGQKLDEGIRAAEMMAEMGFDGIEVSCGIFEDGMSFLRGNFPVDIVLDDLGMFRKQPVLRFLVRHFSKYLVKTIPYSDEYNLEAAWIIKSKVKVPVFVVGGNTNPESMENMVSKGEVDYISLSRALVREPNFPERIMGGSKEPSKCIHCNHCLYYIPIAPLRCYNGHRIKRI